jgi:hypothetical protein
MSLSLILGAIWAVMATIVALLPMRRQFIPGVTLLIAAPVLIIFIGFQHGFWIAALGLLAFLSMFRNPLRYLMRKARGLPTPLPNEMKKEKP